MTIQLGILVFVPLLVPLIVIGRRMLNNLTTDVWVNLKGIAYVVIAGLLLRWLLPPLGGAATIIGVILSSVLSLLIVLSVIVLPARLDKMDDLLWRGGWFDLWKRTGDDDDRVPLVRWARRFALLAFGLFVVIMAASFAITGPSAPESATGANGGQPPAAPAATVPNTSTPAAPAPAATAPSGSPAVIVNTCGGPTPVAVTPTTIKFGTENLQLCYNNVWQTWPANEVAPQTVQLTAWARDKTHGYGVIVVADGSRYLIRTTAFG